MKGLITALVTPFDLEGKVDEKALRTVVRHNIDKMKVDGLYVGGSTGEAFLMSKEERIRAFEIIKDEAKDAVTLIAQIGSLNMDEVIELGHYAKSLSYDALSAITPYYYNFTFEEVYNFYREIQEKVDHEMIIYSNPGMAGGNLDVKKFEQLFELNKVLGVKFSSADIGQLERLRAYFPNQLIYFGYDEIAMVGHVLGCDGAIGSTYNVMGQHARTVMELVKNGQIEDARILQHKLADLIGEIVDNGLYQTIKAVLNVENNCGGYIKKPFMQANEKQVKRAVEIHSKINNLMK